MVLRGCYTCALYMSLGCYNEMLFVTWVRHLSIRVTPALQLILALCRMCVTISTIAGRRWARAYHRCDNFPFIPVAPVLHGGGRRPDCHMGVTWLGKGETH